MSRIEEIDSKTLRALIARVEHAIEHDLALEADDMRLLLKAIHTLMTLQSRMEDRDVTLHKLRKLLGMVTSSEKRGGTSSAKKDTVRAKSPKLQTKPAPARTEHHKLETVKKGDPCPACPKGRLGKKVPEILLRVSGSAPLEAVKHVAERLACHLCGYTETAPLPDAVMNDGVPGQQYGYSARSVMAIHKHFSGIPYYHQETLNGLFGCPVTASTVFDQCEYVADAVMPCFYELQRQAAGAGLFYIDDTNNRILAQQSEERPKRSGRGTQTRSGVYTSGLIAVTPEGKEIYLYETSLGHAGEFIDDILKKRNTGLPPPVIMSDALSRNRPVVTDNIIMSLCNAHGRRQFIDVENNFPDEVSHIAGLYGAIWKNEKDSREKDHSAAERTAYHQTHSLPVMKEIKSWCDAWLVSEDREEHSGLGKACRYFVTHYDGLVQFCKTPGAPVDNNHMEEGLKMIIRSRKNSHFYKTANGAGVANVLASVIATAWRNDINPFDYLNAVQRNADAARENPGEWLPWTVQACKFTTISQEK